MIRNIGIVSAAALAAALGFAAPASALTMKECGAKYQTAKQDGSLKGQKWNEFRKAECGDDDASAAEAAAAVKEDAAPAKPTAAKPAAANAAPATTAAPEAKTAVKPAASSGKVVFPNEVSTKYAGESAGRARLHTCVDQYRANKDSGGNGELKWIEKGGGYYSQCNAKLKG